MERGSQPGVPFKKPPGRLLFEAGESLILTRRSSLSSPKLMPYMPAMKANIAQALGLPAARVGVKATTNEHLGFLGREEGYRRYGCGRCGPARDRINPLITHGQSRNQLETNTTPEGETMQCYAHHVGKPLALLHPGENASTNGSQSATRRWKTGSNCSIPSVGALTANSSVRKRRGARDENHSGAFSRHKTFDDPSRVQLSQ